METIWIKTLLFGVIVPLTISLYLFIRLNKNKKKLGVKLAPTVKGAAKHLTVLYLVIPILVLHAFYVSDGLIQNEFTSSLLTVLAISYVYLPLAKLLGFYDGNILKNSEEKNITGFNFFKLLSIMTVLFAYMVVFLLVIWKV